MKIGLSSTLLTSISISALCSLMALHFVWPDVIWMEHICAHACFVCAWILQQHVQLFFCESLLWAQQNIITLMNSEWLSGFLSSHIWENHEATLSHLFHVYPDIKADEAFKTATSPMHWPKHYYYCSAIKPVNDINVILKVILCRTSYPSTMYMD